MIKQPELGKKVSDLRKAQGLTQEELVEKCNLSVRTLQRIESGEVTPRPITVKLIFEALGVSFDKTIKNKGLILMWLEQFYISIIDLFNLKTNTMKKVSILSAITASILSGVFFFNSELGAQNNSIANGLPKDGNATSPKKHENNYYIRPKVSNVFQWALNPVEVNLPLGNNFMTNNGVIKRQDGHIYIIPYKTGELKVTSKDYSQEFEVLPLPAADFKIGGEIRKRGSMINVSQLLENEEIKANYGLGITTDFGVFEYSIFYNQDKEDEERFIIDDNIISSKEIELIKTGLKKGKSVHIDYIALRMPDGFVINHGIYFIENK
jgi:transcriptional regulator with XRE-family HTH domain